jgi:hypothetical protein
LDAEQYPDDRSHELNLADQTSQPNQFLVLRHLRRWATEEHGVFLSAEKPDMGASGCIRRG